MNLVQHLKSKAGELKAIKSSEEGRQTLAALRRYLSSVPSESAATAIRNWLDTGEDAATQLEFKVGREGSLKEAPSLRVFLLDYLTQIDPAAASSCAEKILGTMNAPDEWAISLRAYGLANPTPDPNANYMVSYNLLTQTATPSGAELAARDREALRVVQE